MSFIAEFITSHSSAIYAAIAFYLIPVVIGIGLLQIQEISRFLITKKLSQSESQDLSYYIIGGVKAFTYGALLIFIQALLIYNYWSQGNFNTQLFVGTVVKSFFILLSVSVLIEAYKMHHLHTRFKLTRNTFYNILSFLALLVLSGVTYTFWRWDSGLNTTLNWDIYHQQTLATLIMEGNFDFFTSNISDSFQFNGYSTLFHTFLVIPQAIFHPQILEFWWFIEFVHLFTTVLVSYAFAQIISKSRWVGLISGIFGAFIFEAAVAFTSLFFIPQTLASTVVVAFIADVFYREHKYGKGIYTLLTLNFVVFAAYILLNHLIIGTLGLFLVAFSCVYFYLSKKGRPGLFENAILIGSFLLFAVIPLVLKQFDLNSINRGEAEFFNFAFDLKLRFLRGFYGYAHYAFLPLGYIYALKAKNTSYKLLIVLANGLLALILGPIPYSFKLLTIGRFVIHAVLALGVWFLVKDFSYVVKTLLIGILTIVLAMILVINFDDFKQVPGYKAMSTHITQNEIDAAEFLKQTYKDKNVLLLSDPATMHLLEGLSNINTPGGAYTTVHTREILSEVYLRRDSDVTGKLLSIRDSLEPEEPEVLLLAVSGRFRQWQLAPERDRYGIHWNVWKPYDLSARENEDYDFIYYLREFLGYREVFRNEGLVILEVNKNAVGIEADALEDINSVDDTTNEEVNVETDTTEVLIDDTRSIWTDNLERVAR